MSLDIINLRKRFGSTVALDGMSFTVQPGELYGFVGSNGAGKTTTMRIIMGVLATDSGEVQLNGTPLDFTTRRAFGYMPSERGLYPKMRVGDQLIYLAQLRGLSQADATKAMTYWTERLGVAHRRGDDVESLSLGNQQRVQLAAALVNNPDVLILDEPFSGLDPVAVDTMSSVLKDKAQEGATVVFSSHQLELVERLCDRVGICASGKIISEGTIDQLRTRGENIVEIAGPDYSALHSALSAHGIAVEQKRDSALVTIPAGKTDQDILHLAQSLGAVHVFAPHKPHLTEIFKDVVIAPNVAEEKPEKPKKKGLAALFGGK